MKKPGAVHMVSFNSRFADDGKAILMHDSDPEAWQIVELERFLERLKKPPQDDAADLI